MDLTSRRIASFGTDTLQHEWGADGMASDAGVVNPPPVEVKTASPVAESD